MANKTHPGIMAPSTRKGVKTKSAQIPSSAKSSAPSPIRGLPLEVLSTIFAWAMVDSWRSSTSCCGDLLKFMLVCSQWRDAAQSSPTVWSTIIVILARTARATRGASRQARQLAAVEMYLRRSGQIPLKISISGREMDPADEIVQRLVAHSSRWESLNIKLTVVNTIKNIPTVVRENIPRLSTLTLTHNEFEFDLDDFSAEDDLVAFVIFEDAPSLHTIEFISWPKPATLKLPWSQIHHLSAHNMIPNDCIRLLKVAPALSSCEFTMRMPTVSETWGPMATHCVADHLQSFILKSGDHFLSLFQLIELLRSVTFPSLEILEIHGNQVASTTRVRFHLDGALLASIRRSNCPLDRLKLHHVPLRKGGLAEVFVLLRSLRCLEIDAFKVAAPGSPLDTDFLRGLVYPDNSNGVRSLPRLRRLSLSCSLEESGFNMLADVLESRRAAFDYPHGQVSPLESVNLHIKGVREFPDDFNSRLRILASGGMKIRINGENPEEINTEMQRL